MSTVVTCPLTVSTLHEVSLITIASYIIKPDLIYTSQRSVSTTQVPTLVADRTHSFTISRYKNLTVYNTV